jgi:DNA end-binding protein Ku
MRAIWSGSVSFGLVNIPVKLYSASETEAKIDFNLLHEKDMSPIRYAKFCKLEGVEVPNEEIVKGYEYSKGEYVIMTDDDFKQALPATTQAIEITDFTAEIEIDDIYFEKPYYLEPDKGAAKPYALLREALRRSGKVGIARFVLRNREHLAAIKPSGDVLILDQLRYQSDIRKPDELNLPSSEQLQDRELDLALALVDKLTVPFNPEQYTDTHTAELRRVIEEKAAGRVPVAREEAPQPTNVVDLMSVLKRSLEQEKRAA